MAKKKASEEIERIQNFLESQIAKYGIEYLGEEYSVTGGFPREFVDDSHDTLWNIDGEKMYFSYSEVTPYDYKETIWKHYKNYLGWVIGNYETEKRKNPSQEERDLVLANKRNQISSWQREIEKCGSNPIKRFLYRKRISGYKYRINEIEHEIENYIRLCEKNDRYLADNEARYNRAKEIYDDIAQTVEYQKQLKELITAQNNAKSYNSGKDDYQS